MHNSISHFDRNKIIKNAFRTKYIRNCELIFLYNTAKSIQELNELVMMMPHISDDPENGFQFDNSLEQALLSQREQIILGIAKWKEHKIIPMPKNWVPKSNTEYHGQSILERAAHWLKIKHLQTDNIRNIFEVAGNMDELDMFKEVIVRDHKYREDKLKMCYNRRKKQLEAELGIGKAGSSKNSVGKRS